MVKISLIPGIKQAQGISLTPQLIQSIKLFELNNIDLEHYLADQILENPFLENKDDSYDESLDPNDETTNNENCIHASVNNASFVGSTYQYILSSKIGKLYVISGDTNNPLKVGEEVFLSLDEKDVKVLND